MLTREQAEAILATHLWGIPIVLETLLNHDAALRTQLEAMEQERDELVRQRNKLSGDLADTRSWKGDWQLSEKLLHEAKAQLATALAGVEKAEKERDNWHAIVKDECDEDTLFREAAGADDTSNSYGVESHTEILKRVKAERDRLLAGVERLKSMSTVEMMCENLNVKHHVEEWEARCLKAEAERDTLAGRCGALEEGLTVTAKWMRWWLEHV